MGLFYYLNIRNGERMMVYTKEEKLEVIRLYLDFGIIKYPEGITAQQKENIKKRVKSWVEGDVRVRMRDREGGLQNY